MQVIPSKETYILLSQKNIEHEDIKMLLDNMAVKNNKNSENIDGAKEIIKKNIRLI